jgi:hypothetical protein
LIILDRDFVSSSSLPLRCLSEDDAKISNKDGGARRIRTDDILLAKQALYQLSYGPSHSV